MARTSSLRRLILLALVIAGSALVATKTPTDVAAPAEIAPSAAPADPVALEARVDPEPRGRRDIATSTPDPTEAPAAASEAPAVPTAAPLRVVAPVAPVAPAATPAPQACAQSFFCYPRLGIAGPIITYDDCSGATDVGLAIRQLTCVHAGIWLAGHAYTQFGRLTGFQVGDEVFVRGRRVVITRGSVRRSCEPTTQAIAPLSLQTSLESSTCGRGLVVQGR